jgi:O-antigen ligase
MGLIIAQFLPVWWSSYALLLLFIMLGIGYKQLNWRLFKQNTFLYPWLGLFAWQLLSFSWTTHYQDGLANFNTQALLLLLPVFFFLSPPDKKQLFALQATYILAASLAAFTAVVIALFKAGSTTHAFLDALPFFLFYTGLAEPIMHPGYFSLHLVTALLFLLVNKAYYRQLVGKFWLLPLGVLTGVLLLLNARMTLFSAFFTLALVLLLWAIRKKQRRPLLIFFTTSVLVGATTWTVLPDAMKFRLTEFTRTTHFDMATYGYNDYTGLTIRLAQWTCSWELIKQQPILGSGIGDGKTDLNQVYKDKGFIIGIKEQFNSHNQWIESVIFGGIAQMLLLLLAFVQLAIHAYRQKNIPLIAWLLFIFLCSQTETVLTWHRGVLFFALAWPLLWWRGKVEKAL